MQTPLSLTHPAQAEGRKTYAAGLGHETNPHPKGSPEWRAWGEGWRAAAAGDEGKTYVRAFMARAPELAALMRLEIRRA